MTRALVAANRRNPCPPNTSWEDPRLMRVPLVPLKVFRLTLPLPTSAFFCATLGHASTPTPSGLCVFRFLTTLHSLKSAPPLLDRPALPTEAYYHGSKVAIKYIKTSNPHIQMGLAHSFHQLKLELQIVQVCVRVHRWRELARACFHSRGADVPIRVPA